MKIFNKLSFYKKIFLACLLTALVPLLCSSVVMIRLFTASLDRQNLEEGRTQITKAEARLEAVFEKCEEACDAIATDKKAACTMIEKSETDHEREMYLLLYQATQETSGYAQFSIYDAGGHLRYTTDTERKEKENHKADCHESHSGHYFGLYSYDYVSFTLSSAENRSIRKSVS